jgi:aspartate kinase
MGTSIFKFGGSCLKDAAAFDKIAKIMKMHSKEKMVFVSSALQGITDKLIELAKNASNEEFVSAKMKEIKDQHISIIEQVFKKDEDAYNDANCFLQECLADIRAAVYDIDEFGLENSLMDYIMSYGEKMSTYLLFLYVDMLEIPTEYILGEDIIITDSNFGNALPLWDHTLHRIEEEFAPVIDNKEDQTIFCVTGFIGRDKLGNTTTLGRGGSDFTATIISRCLFDSCKDKDIRVVLWKEIDSESQL